jgi:hypothetical protein
MDTFELAAEQEELHRTLTKAAQRDPRVAAAMAVVDRHWKTLG